MRLLIFFNIIVYLLIILFTYTATGKLTGYAYFSAQLSMFPVLNKAPTFYALLIPAAELFTVVLLFFPFTRITGLYASLILLFVFTFYLLVMVIAVPHLPCTCGGIISKMTWQQHIFFNSSCILLNISGIYLYKRMDLTNA